MPFIHKFETEKAKYIYDAPTSQILEVDKVTFAIIDDIDILSEDEIIAKYAPHYPRHLLLQALRDLQKARSEQNLFLDHHYQSVSDIPLYADYTPHPKMLVLQLTEKCNLRCCYCLSSYRENSSLDMTFATAAAAVTYFAEIADGDKLAILFGGGEPLLKFPLIKKIVAHLENLRPEKPKLYYLSTNLVNLTEEMIDFFLEHDFMLQVSLDGPKAKHDRYRVTPDGQGTYETVVGNLMKLKKRSADYIRSKVKYSCVVAPPYDPAEIIQFFSSFERPWAYNINMVSGAGTTFFRDYCRSTDSVSLSAIPFTEKLREVLGKHDGRGEEDILYGMVSDMHGGWLARLHERRILSHPVLWTNHSGQCRIATEKLCVDVKGRFFPCERLIFNRDYIIGDVDKGVENESIIKVCEKFDKLRSHRCRTCWAVRLCPFCLQDLMFYEDDQKKLDAICDEVMKPLVHERLRLYCSLLEENPKAFDKLSSSGDL
ncbi:MAG: radical SAM protein [Candidatus Omnitrophota bacterium]